MYDLLISIVTHNSDLQILNNLINQIEGEKRINIKIIIIDNLSQKNYFYKLIKFKCNVISAGKNKGYGTSHNLSNKITDDSKYILILNPDINLEKNTLFDCFKFMESHSNYSMISPLLKKNSKKIFRIEKRNFSLFEIITRRFLKDDTLINNLDHKIVNKIIDNNFISGAFMFIRRDIFRLVGGFDERFFMYFEDVDICKRIMNYGKIGYMDYSFAYHKRSRDSYKSLKMMFIHINSFFKFHFKNYKM